ncbi:MAG TPA: hypothetical protein DCL61_26925 [Cyanobacteria bacterium UBA12227]|nr:hypothetical protein [Cyanobacteria bacterium UBA12227]HAX89382.1 hypothetical protein [Cyanobacteria bacterium UBA11370]HBY79741.1 hypothetical protein [Cyanobacteria bacterium UBA11148]
MISKWEIFYVPSCRYAKPIKDKFVVIAYVNPSPHGFFINSRINKFISNRPYLLACEAQILANQHPFLKYDSYIDCREIFSFLESELTDTRGIMSSDAQAAVIEAVNSCRVLERIHKTRI